MGRKLEYTELNDLFNSGSNFSITDDQYREKMGKELPKDKSYIKNKSPLARIARKYGYSIEIFETPIIQRTVNFIKITK